MWALDSLLCLFMQQLYKAVCAQTCLACLQRAEERMGQGVCVQIINKSNVLNLSVSQHYSFLVTAIQPFQNLGFLACYVECILRF